MTTKHTSVGTAALVPLLLGGLFASVFLMINDPDKVPIETINAWKWFVLCPMAFLIGLWMSANAWLSGLSMISGAFIGACIAAIMLSSNIWPIAAAFWTALWFFPVLVGSLAGGLIGWSVRKIRSK